MEYQNTCNICTEKYNKSNRCKTECAYCNFEACNSCWQTYFLNEVTPKCMNKDCEKEWTNYQMRKKFTQAFINTKFKKHTEEVLYEKEKSLMPATQLIIENQIQIENRIKHMDEINTQINKLLAEKRRLELEIFRLRGKTEFERKTFVRPCSNSECRGFLSTQWKCGLCETFTCPECHENKGKCRDEQHMCDPNNVATAKLISSDSKPCPKCHANIFKIDGCDQMFCTMCHTAFSWATGLLETNIHNPHYFEWLRQNNVVERNPLDIQCGRELTHRLVFLIHGVERDMEDGIETDLIVTESGPYAIMVKDKCGDPSLGITQFTREKKAYTTIACQLIRNIIHINAVYINALNIDTAERNQKLRIDFMRNKINEEEYKRKLRVENKKQAKQTELLRVHQLMRDVATEIIHRFISQLTREKVINVNTLDEIPEIVKYVNELLVDISETYNSVHYVYDNMCMCVKNGTHMSTQWELDI